MEQEAHNNRFKIFGIEVDIKEISLFTFIGFMFIFGPKLLTLILGYNDFNKTGQIGDTFGGLTAPFLSYFGSVLVYLAFKAQIDANNKITQQFDEQNTDQLFFRVFDNFKELKNELSYDNKFGGPDFSMNTIYKGKEAVKELAKDFSNSINNERIVDLSIQIIEKHLDEVDNAFIYDIVSKLELPQNRKSNKEIDLFIETLKKTPSGKRMKFILEGYRIEFSNKIDQLLDSKIIQDTIVGYQLSDSIAKLGGNYFYDYDFEYRFPIYQLAVRIYKKRKKEHLDSLLNTIEYLFKITRQSKNKNFYFDYLYYNLAESEKFIMFITMVSSDLNIDFKKDLVTFFNQFDVHFSSEYFFNNPAEAIVKKEIKSILQSV